VYGRSSMCENGVNGEGGHHKKFPAHLPASIIMLLGKWLKDKRFSPTEWSGLWEYDGHRF